jgi:hypothetical protein
VVVDGQVLSVRDRLRILMSEGGRIRKRDWGPDCFLYSDGVELKLRWGTRIEPFTSPHLLDPSHEWEDASSDRLTRFWIALFESLTTKTIIVKLFEEKPTFQGERFGDLRIVHVDELAFEEGKDGRWRLLGEGL